MNKTLKTHLNTNEGILFIDTENVMKINKVHSSLYYYHKVITKIILYKIEVKNEQNLRYKYECNSTMCVVIPISVDHFVSLPDL